MIDQTTYDDVVAEMQNAEEIGGPEGDDYIETMLAIARHALDRANTCGANMEPPRAPFGMPLPFATPIAELLRAQGFPPSKPSPPAGTITVLPHYGMAVKKVLDADEMWWSVMHVPLDGHGNVMQGEEWGDMGCGPGTPTSEYRSEAAADWLIDQLAKVPPAGAAEDRMWRLLEHARTRDLVERLRAELATAATGSAYRMPSESEKATHGATVEPWVDHEVEWIVNYTIATYAGTVTVRASENADREHIIARAEDVLRRKSGPLPLGARSYKIERSHDGASR